MKITMGNGQTHLDKPNKIRAVMLRIDDFFGKAKMTDFVMNSLIHSTNQKDLRRRVMRGYPRKNNVRVVSIALHIQKRKGFVFSVKIVIHRFCSVITCVVH